MGKVMTVLNANIIHTSLGEALKKANIKVYGDDKLKSDGFLKVVTDNIEYYKCADCGNEFILTEKDKNWYINKGLKLPKRCDECLKKKVRLDLEEKIEHTCIECGETFYMTKSHEEWYINKGLTIPVRCNKCINKKKDEKKFMGR